MSEAWSECVGHVVNGEFPLQEYLGGKQTAVFLTERPEQQGVRAAIKLVPAGANADLQLSHWRLVQGFSHPSLIRILDSGRCQIGNRELLFLVTEYAEENLAQIVRERSLAATETGEMMGPILDTLTWLHGRGLVHGRLKPANILALNDQLKLSSDGICAIGSDISLKSSIYDAPEIATAGATPAADVWSLGMTLSEVLTQRLPAQDEQGQADPVLPEGLSAPFSDVVAGCLRRDPAQRSTPAKIAEQLRPKPAPEVPQTAAAQTPPAAPVPPLPASASVPPATPVRSQPANPAPAAPVATAPQVKAPVTTPARSPVAARRPEQKRPFVLVAAAIAAVLVLTGWALLHHGGNEGIAPKPSSDSQPSPTSAGPVASASKSKPSPVPRRSGGRAGSTSGTTAPTITASTATAPVPATAAPSTTAPSAPTSRAAATSEVVQQVLPNVPEAARNTIQGTVRVNVKAHVDGSGGVSDAELDSPGPSQYFARLSLQATKSWKFAQSQDVKRTFIVHFQFTNAATRASAIRSQ